MREEAMQQPIHMSKEMKVAQQEWDKRYDDSTTSRRWWRNKMREEAMQQPASTRVAQRDERKVTQDKVPKDGR